MPLGYNAFAYLLPGLIPGAAGGSADNLTATMLGMRDLLIAADLFTETSCFVSMDEDPFPTPAPPMCAIAPGGFGAIEPDITGGGRYVTTVEVEFTLRILLRHTKDVAGQDTLALTDASRGGFGFVFRCVDALAEEFVLDGSGNQITTRGLKPGRLGNLKRWGRDRMLSVMPVTFSTRVILGLALPDRETAP